MSTLVDPVNATLSMPMCKAIAAPAVGPYPGKILTTPGGNPACQNNMRKQSLAEIITEPSKTAGGVGGSGPNPTTLPAENRGNIKKDVAMEEEAGGNTTFPR